MNNCKTIIALSEETFTSCGDVGLNIIDKLSKDVDNLKTIGEFNQIMTSELIDVKNRKTLSKYPTLKALHERYLFGFQDNPNSSSFDYDKMGTFISLVGDYWVDLIEQVVPSTTIWGSTIKYSNTIFDKDKYKYKRYSLITCETDKVIEYPSPTSGFSESVEVVITDLSVPDYSGPECLKPESEKTICSGVTIQQIDYGSEFIGYINIKIIY